MMSLIAAALVASSPPIQASASDLSWMAGYWLDCADGREASETWTDARGPALVGSAVTLRDGGFSFEAAVIGPHQGGLAYFAQPNGAPPTIFPLIRLTAESAVFENPENDFPRRIVYARDGDGLTARIEGAIDGRDRAMAWRFDRAELNARCPR